MSRTSRFAAFVALAGWGLSCGDAQAPRPAPPIVVASAALPAPSASGAVEDFRRAPPPAEGTVAPELPKILEARTSNGIRVLVVERHDRPLVSIRVIVPLGGAEAKPAVAPFLASMWLRGTKTRSAIALDEAAQTLGASLGADADFNRIELRADARASELVHLLDLVGDVVRNPALEPAEIERERARRLTAALEEGKVLESVQQRAILGELYAAGHPYHLPPRGDEPTVRGVTRDALSKLQSAYVRPDATTLVVVGDTTKDATVAAIEKAFAGWQGKADAPKLAPPLPAAGPIVPRVVVIDRPRAVLSELAIAFPGVAWPTPDRDALVLLARILGGTRSSRLDGSLRERHAWATSTRVRLSAFRAGGPFFIGATVKTERAVFAASEILDEMRRLRTQLVTEEELEAAKTSSIESLSGRLETIPEAADAVAAIATWRLPLDEGDALVARIRSITREELLRVAIRYLTPERARVVVVGHGALLRHDFVRLGIGDVMVRNADGTTSSTPTPK